jgi:hypothetical protein
MPIFIANHLGIVRVARAMCLMVLSVILAGCPDKSAAAIDEARSDLQSFSPRFLEALSAAARDLSDFDEGTVHGFEGQIAVDSVTVDDSFIPIATLSVNRYFESGQHVGSGPTKQTEWTKCRGTQTVVLRQTSAPPEWELVETKFQGEREVKPLSLYTDLSQRTVSPVSEIPDQDKLVQAALKRLAESNQAARR